MTGVGGETGGGRNKAKCVTRSSEHDVCPRPGRLLPAGRVRASPFRGIGSKTEAVRLPVRPTKNAETVPGVGLRCLELTGQILTHIRGLTATGPDGATNMLRATKGVVSPHPRYP